MYFANGLNLLRLFAHKNICYPRKQQIAHERTSPYVCAV